MEEKTDNLYNVRLRKVCRRLFQDDGDNDEQEKREAIDNRFSEERRIQLEEVKKWFLMRQIWTIKIISRHDYTIIFW